MARAGDTRELPPVWRTTGPRQRQRTLRAVLDVPSEDAQLLQLTNNAVYALPRAGIVIRIGRTHQLRDRVARVIRLAHWFAEIDAPTIRSAPGIEHPIEVGGLSASIWRYVPPRSPAPTVSDLGAVLREFHALGVPSFPLPLWNPVRDARQRLADAEGLDKGDREYLVEWCDRLDPQVAALNRRAERRLVHGDAHVGNLLRESSVRTVLCDFDATCLGPWQVDLAAVAVGDARFGVTGTHHTLATTYGFDVTTDPDWPVLKEARELKMIASAVPLLTSSPRYATEFANRIESMRSMNDHAQWIPFADLKAPTKATTASPFR